MISTSNRPDLRRIGESAFTEVLGTLFSWRATIRNSATDSTVSAAPDQITSSVLLKGERLSGSVHLQLPQAFAAQAVHRLTGLDSDVANANELQDDAAGELANMVAGRVAAHLATDGYPCQLGTPSVCHGARLPSKPQPGAIHARTDLVCEGHLLSLEIQCCYADR